VDSDVRGAEPPHGVGRRGLVPCVEIHESVVVLNDRARLRYGVVDGEGVHLVAERRDEGFPHRRGEGPQGRAHPEALRVGEGPEQVWRAVLKLHAMESSLLACRDLRLQGRDVGAFRRGKQHVKPHVGAHRRVGGSGQKLAREKQVVPEGIEGTQDDGPSCHAVACCRELIEHGSEVAVRRRRLLGLDEQQLIACLQSRVREHLREARGRGAPGVVVLHVDRAALVLDVELDQVGAARLCRVDRVEGGRQRACVAVVARHGVLVVVGRPRQCPLHAGPIGQAVAGDVGVVLGPTVAVCDGQAGLTRVGRVRGTGLDAGTSCHARLGAAGAHATRPGGTCRARAAAKPSRPSRPGRPRFAGAPAHGPVGPRCVRASSRATARRHILVVAGVFGAAGAGRARIPRRHSVFVVLTACAGE
jgi:hypothetical protein